MPLRVNISISAGGRDKPVSSRLLDMRKITIGRDDECSLTLEDAQKHVSRVHAELDEEGGAYWMRVVSKVNPVLVNGKRHMFGDRVLVASGDVLTIGLYKLQIVVPEVSPEPEEDSEPDVTLMAATSAHLRPPEQIAPGPPPPVPPPPAPAPAAPAPLASSTPRRLMPDALPDVTYIPPAPVKGTHADTTAPGFADGETEDLTYVPPSKSRNPSQPVDLAAEVLAAAAPVAEPTEEATFIPKPTQSAPAAPATELPADEITFIRPRQETPAAQIKAKAPDTPPPVEEDFSEDRTTIRRPDGTVSPPMPQRAPTSPPAAPPPPPPMVDLSDEPTFIRPAETDLELGLDSALDFDLSEPDIEEEVTLVRPAVPASAPPPVQAPVRVSAPSPTAAKASASDASAERALRAFLEGAGLTHIKVSNPETFLRESGAMVRAAVEGIIMLLLARAETRKAFGVEAPASGQLEDDRLKAIADPAEVIAFLFDPVGRVPGGPDPLKAFGDALLDLRAHHVALLAAMQTGIQGAVRRLDPKIIEQEHSTHLGGINLTRKSKLWDLALARHESFTRDVEENFHSTLGPEVLAAYLAEVKRLRGGR